MTYVDAEIADQPDCWRTAAGLAAGSAEALPRPGERVAAVGCGTSWFIAMAYAGLRELAGQGETDAFQASEMPTTRRYDRVVAISRSGITTEVVDLLRRVNAAAEGASGPWRTAPATLITAVFDAPAAGLAAKVVAMPFADERSVVQTRFATSALALLRASLGEDLTRAIADAEDALRAPLPVDPETTGQVTFLGRGWTVGLAYEAALKCREAATLWTEAYPAMDYRHGPIAIAAPGRAVWAFGEVPDGLPGEVARTGAAFVAPARDPLADLVLAQRFAVAAAVHRGLNPDAPPHLARSVVLS
jgi:fructoselysine-6-P-deglycase FrlB-like protein